MLTNNRISHHHEIVFKHRFPFWIKIFKTIDNTCFLPLCLFLKPRLAEKIIQVTGRQTPSYENNIILSFEQVELPKLSVIKINDNSGVSEACRIYQNDIENNFIKSHST